MSTELRDLALFWEMGTGKTAGMIHILRHKFGIKQRIMRTLILSPLVTLHNWKNEFALHSTISPYNVHVFDRSGIRRSSDFTKLMGDTEGVLNENKIAITNYEALQSDKFYEAVLEWNPEIIVCDESHLLKNHQSKRAKKVRIIAHNAENRFILTGTPILNTALDIFNQYYILDKGETFGDSFFAFRHNYFVDENAGWSNRPGHFPKWVARTQTYEELNKLIYSKGFRVTKHECLDLPPLVKEVFRVELSPEQKRIYKEMRLEFVAWIQKKHEEPQAVVAQLAVTKALRLQQIVTGYVKTAEGEEIFINKNPRLEATKALLEQLVPKHKVIVWASFKANYKMLANVCEELKIKYVMLHGDMNGSQKNESVQKFENDESIRVIIANRAAGGIGINLVAASYSIVYSRNFSLGEELQSSARNHRGGSERHAKITKIDLIAPGTIDELVMEALSNKEHISKSILEMKI